MSVQVIWQQAASLHDSQSVVKSRQPVIWEHFGIEVSAVAFTTFSFDF